MRRNFFEAKYHGGVASIPSLSVKLDSRDRFVLNFVTCSIIGDKTGCDRETVFDAEFAFCIVKIFKFTYLNNVVRLAN